MRPESKPADTQHFEAYGELIVRLVPGAYAAGVFTADGGLLWQSQSGFAPGVEPLIANTLQTRQPGRYTGCGGDVTCCLPLGQPGRVAGILAVAVPHAYARNMTELAIALKPVIAVLTHELQSRPVTRKSKVLTERTQELEWLFKVTSGLRSGGNDSAVVEQLLEAAARRVGAGFAGVAIPEKRLDLTYASPLQAGAPALAYQKAHPHLMNYVQRQNKPLLLNKAPPGHAELSDCKMLAVPLTSQAGKVIGMLVFVKSSTSADFGRREQYLGRHVARQLAVLLDCQYDLATGHYTRVAFEQQVNQYLERANGGAHSLVYVDINGMQGVNETFGYDTGDEAIVRIAGLLSTPLLPSDAIVARTTGDRFVLFLPAHEVGAAQECARVLQKEAERIAFGEGRRRVTLSLSCGVAHFNGQQAISRTIAAAELACKTAKEHGRNRCEVYLDIDQSMMRRRSDVSGMAQLRDALDNDRLCVYAQKIAPVNDIHNARGMECLVRMLDEDGSVVSPQAFMSVAQRYQLLQEVDAWVIRNTLKILAPFAANMMHAGLYASINISGQSLSDAGFLERVADWVRGSRVPPGALTFEITETAAVSNLAHADELIRGLRQMGCRFALDDFGTGVNSLSYLKSLHVQRVKIDGSFVRDINTNRRSEAMVRAVIQLANSLSVDCVAEYVADEAIYKKLRPLGVGYVQGYFIHEPEPLINVLQAFSAAESQRMRRLSLGM